MNIVSTDELRLVEAQEISTGTSAEVLMERAGWEAARLINREYSFVRSAHIWVGKGHNGGDGLVIARALASIGWDVQVWLMLPEAEIGELPRRKLAELKEEFPELSVQSGEEHRVWPRTDEILVDALMGIGAKGDLRGSLRQRVEEINQARKLRFFRVVSVDTPSGLHEGSRSLDESTVGENQAVVADLTVTIWVRERLFIPGGIGALGGSNPGRPHFSIPPHPQFTGRGDCGLGDPASSAAAKCDGLQKFPRARLDHRGLPRIDRCAPVDLASVSASGRRLGYAGGAVANLSDCGRLGFASGHGL